MIKFVFPKDYSASFVWIRDQPGSGIRETRWELRGGKGLNEKFGSSNRNGEINLEIS